MCHFFLGTETAVETTSTGTSSSTKSMPFGSYTSNTPENSTSSTVSIIIATLTSYTIYKSEDTGTNTTSGLRIYDILPFSHNPLNIEHNRKKITN